MTTNQFWLDVRQGLPRRTSGVFLSYGVEGAKKQRYRTMDANR